MHIDLHNLPYLLTVAIFFITYIGIAIGGIPLMALDRTGIALLGAITMIVANNFSPEQALLFIDAPTILLLFSLMVIAGQLKISGFYAWLVVKLYFLMQRPKMFLAVVIVVSGVLSAFLVNDVICLALTPILILGLKRAGLNPVPYLLAMAAASNIGSAATIIGNPQNMLIGQVGRLNFLDFLLWCLPVTVLSLFLVYVVIFVRYGKWLKIPEEPVLQTDENILKDFNKHQTIKGILFLMILIVLFFTKIPRELSALVLGGCVLCSRSIQTRKLLANVDWHLICLFCGLFIVIGAINHIEFPAIVMRFLQEKGVDLRDLSILTVASLVLSNLVSNVPAVMLLIQFLDQSQPTLWYVLALSSTFAGNLITIGSIANLITIEQAAQYGVTISFKEHARIGIPITLGSILVLLVWIWTAI